jgi:hypothetical protein
MSRQIELPFDTTFVETSTTSRLTTSVETFSTGSRLLIKRNMSLFCLEPEQFRLCDQDPGLPLTKSPMKVATSHLRKDTIMILRLDCIELLKGKKWSETETFRLDSDKIYFPEVHAIALDNEGFYLVYKSFIDIYREEKSTEGKLVASRLHLHPPCKSKLVNLVVSSSHLYLVDFIAGTISIFTKYGTVLEQQWKMKVKAERVVFAKVSLSADELTLFVPDNGNKRIMGYDTRTGLQTINFPLHPTDNIAGVCYSEGILYVTDWGTRHIDHLSAYRCV